MYRKFNRILKLARPPTKIRFNTNGFLLSSEKIKQIVDSKVVDVINFSIDAATEETYLKIRGPGFKQVISNIKNFTSYKKTMNSEIPHIVINMCVMKENYKEIPQFAELAKEVGAESIDLFHLNHKMDWKIKRHDNFIFDYKEQEKMDPDIHDNIIIKAYEKCRELKIDMNFVGSIFLSNKDKEKKEIIGQKIRELDKVQKCLAPWSRVVVGVDGNVRMCYFHEDGIEIIGNLYKNSFQEIWNGKEAIKVREEFLDKGHSRFCEKRNICMYLGRK